jgi:hypothetical protein
VDPIVSFLKVVERAENEHDIDRLVGKRQSARITDLGRQSPRSEASGGLIDMARRDVDEMHPVALRQQPIGMHTSAPTDIEDTTRRSR